MMLFPALYVGARLWKRTPLIKPEDMDFITGIAEIEADCYDEPPPKNRIEKFWAWLVSTDLCDCVMLCIMLINFGRCKSF